MNPLALHRFTCSLLAAGTLAFAAAPAHAQWSNSADAPLVVADAADGQVQPKIATAPDGTYYVSWFDGHVGSFSIYLQHLDAQGNELWPHGGVLVATRAYSSTTDYGLGVDADGNAYLAYNCCANNVDDEHIQVNRVDANGTLPWGAEGVTVSAPASTEPVYNAYVTATGDGNIAVIWSTESVARVQKLTPDGTPLWATNGVAVSTTTAGTFLAGDVHSNAAGDVIASWVYQAGPFLRALYTQKLAADDGAALWDPAGVRVFGVGAVQLGYYPPFIDDGAGGGVFYDYDTTALMFVPRVQHVAADGSLLLGANGVVATTDTSINHTNTAAAYDAASGDIYVVWRDSYTTAGGADFDGLSAQRVDSTGALQWGDTGKVLVAPADSTDSTLALSQITAMPAPGGFVAGWITGAYPAANNPISVARVNADGSYAWPSQNVVVKSDHGTSRTGVTAGADGELVYVWTDITDGSGAGQIQAQRLNLDGSLGGSSDDHIFVDGFDGN